MSRRRHRRRDAKPQQLASPASVAAPRENVREARRVKRLAYTRSQASQALGVSRSTFDRRVLPYIETVVMPWGGRLIPADELERLVAERRRPPRERQRHSPPPGRPAVVPSDVVKRIRTERGAGKTLAQIARELNADGTPTAHGGERWWPSTVRAVCSRLSTPA